MKPIIVWGAGGHAKVVAASLRLAGRWRIEGFLDDVDPGRAGEPFCGARIVGGRASLTELRRAGHDTLVLAFGANVARLALWSSLVGEGWRFPAIVDPRAGVADDVEIGAGSYVAAGAIVQPGARLGAQVIVNTGAIVEHDVRVGDGAHLGPRSCLGGHAEVGRACWLGAGALVRDRARIGAGTIIGMGSVVLGNIADGVVAYGQPARVVREAPS